MPDYGISLLSLIPMRKEPKEQSEMVSQLLFGENYEVLNENNGFLQIVTGYDRYTGWIDRAMHNVIPGEYYQYLTNEAQPVQSALMISIERKGSHPVQILAGSTLPGYSKKKDHIEINGNIYNVRWTFGKFNSNGFDTVIKTASFFLNSPYLWGGRSSFGCDCSGFVQVLYKIHGIPIFRDAHQQAEQGSLVSSLAEAKTGDLAFFSDTEGNVYHVGMVIAPGEIIHSSGYVHIDQLDEKGIFNIRRQEYSHFLHSIKRYNE
jgi:cell wall-associated NlpC family hydrolase